MNTLLLATLLVDSYLHVKAGAQTCSELLSGESGQIGGGSWTNNAQGFYSTIEWLVGDTIDFYNVQFYNQLETDYSNGQELIVHSKPILYTSICEMNRFGHVPTDKIVVGKCSCDGCGSAEASMAACKGEPTPSWLDDSIAWYISPETLSDSFAEVPLNDAVGGVMVWKYSVNSNNNINNGLDFRYAIQENKNSSGFFEDGKSTTVDVPRHVVYYNGWLNQNYSDWLPVFQNASKAGVNYLILAFYTLGYGPLDTVVAWEAVADEDKRRLKAEFPNVKLLCAWGGATDPIEDLFHESTTVGAVTNFVTYAKKQLFDGIDFDLENFGNGTGKEVICTFGYMSYKARKLWPEAIISHAPQSPHFGPLVEEDNDANREAVRAMFAQDKFEGCYDLHLANNHRTTIPVPDPSKYRRPSHSGSELPSNYFGVVDPNATATSNTQTSPVTTTQEHTTSTATTIVVGDQEFPCDCKCTCQK